MISYARQHSLPVGRLSKDAGNGHRTRHRAKAYLRSTSNKDALLVAAADKLHNARATLSDYREVGEQLWLRFKAPKKDQFLFFGALIDTLHRPEAPRVLVGELEKVVNELAHEAK